MISTTRYRRTRLLTLVAGFSMIAVLAAAAQTPPAEDEAETPAAEEAAAAPDVNDTDILKDIDVSKLDWSQLNVDASTLTGPAPKAAPRRRAMVRTPPGRITPSRTALRRYRSSNPSRRSGMRASAPT